MRYSSKKLQNGKEIVLIAIAQEEFAAQYASERLKLKGIDNMFTAKDFIEVSNRILIF